REQQARHLAFGDHARLDGADLAPAGEVEQRVGTGEPGELLEVLDGGEDERDLAVAMGGEGAGGREPALVDDLVAVNGRLLVVGQRGQEEVGVVAHDDLRGRDPARELHQPAGVGNDDAGLDLERVGTAAQQDDGRRLARHRLLAGEVELLAGRGTVDLHGMKGTFRPMSETTTAQKWICDSCGFIYDPADGDPDGGIPPGTAFDDIPDTWFCPVCGARKRDFTPYED